MEGILDMCRILVELIAERLKQKPVPTNLLNLLAMVFNADANYHTKMKNKRTEPSRWTRVLGEGKVFAQMPHFQTHKDPKGWLVEIMNVVSGGREEEGRGASSLADNNSTIFSITFAVGDKNLSEFR